MSQDNEIKFHGTEITYTPQLDTIVDGTYGYTLISNLIEGKSFNYSFALPLPEGFDFNRNFNWSVEDENVAFTAILNSVSTGNYGSLVNSDLLTKIGLNALNGVGQAVSNTFGLGDIYNKAINASMRSSGVATNPNKQLYFDGVEQGDFNFTFKLYPTSRTYAEKVLNAYEKILLYATPRTTSTNENNLELGWFVYPSKISIQMFAPNNKRAFFEIKECVITSINLSFDSMTFHAGGIPTAMTLTIGIKETQLPTRDKYTRSKTVRLFDTDNQKINDEDVTLPEVVSKAAKGAFDAINPMGAEEYLKQKAKELNLNEEQTDGVLRAYHASMLGVGF